MAYAHAMYLTEDRSNLAIRVACNADFQHHPEERLMGWMSRQLRRRLLVGPDLIVRELLEEE